MLRSGQRQAVPTSRGRKDLMSMGTEQLGNHAQDEVVVVDDQDREPRRYRRLSAPPPASTSIRWTT